MDKYDKIKLIGTGAIIILIIYLLQKYFHILWKPTEKTDEELLIDAQNKLVKNVNKTAKSFVDTGKMTITKANFNTYFKSFVEAWENGRVDLLITYLDRIKNVYDFGYLVEMCLKNGINIFEYSDKWSTINKVKFENYQKTVLLPKIPQFKAKIQSDLGKYGDDLIKIIMG